jgi:transposase-like protein
MSQKHKTLSLSEKMKIIEQCESGVLSKSEVGRRYNLSSSLLFTILKKQRED